MCPPKFLRSTIGVGLLLLGAAAFLRAEQLPLKTYTIADGLARDTVNWIMQDSLGFLWFCTSEGLSRFDGYTFTNYGVDQGLPNRELNSIVEARKGDYWIATGDGLVRFDPRRRAANQSEPMFVPYRPSRQFGTSQPQAALEDHFSVLLEDRAGVIWCGSHGGLFKFSAGAPEPRFDRVPLNDAEDPLKLGVTALVQDHSGAIWVGTTFLGLIRFGADGRRTQFMMPPGPQFTHVGGIVEDREGKIWAATGGGLVRLASGGNGSSGPERVYTARDGVSDFVNTVFQTSDGQIWVSCDGGIIEIDPHAQSGGTRKYRVSSSDSNIMSFCQDRDGNLWLGSESGGAIKIARSGFTTYRETDGLSSGRIGGISENLHGNLVVFTADTVNAFADRRFNATRFNLPPGWTRGWGWNQAEFQDHLGDWWVPG